jgi:serine protease Do
MFGKFQVWLTNRRRVSCTPRAIALASLLTGMMMLYGVSGNGQHPGVGNARASAVADMPGIPIQSSFAAIVEKLSPSVVNIKVTKVQKADFPISALPEGPFRDHFRHFFDDKDMVPRERPVEGAGSGVIVSADGLVLTNNHVVEGAKEVRVTLADQRELKANIVGRDPRTDLAVLRVQEAGELQAARLGDSDNLKVGDWVLAIGNPFGLSHTLTSGIVSAKGRVLGAGPYDDFIQTDASINPGNSGGPLFNMQGEVVGINTAIIPNGQGIGFAVPVNMARQLMPELVEHGEVTRGYIGVNIQAVTPDLARAMELKKPEGALVADVVSERPADQAGIKRGDVIVSFDGKEVRDSRQLPGMVAAAPVGEEVAVKVLRSGREKTLRVRVAKLDSSEMEAAPSKESSPPRWGMELRELSPEMARRSGLEEGGVLVVNVKPGSPADKASIRRGDIILEANRKPVTSIQELQRAIVDSGDSNSLLLLVQRYKSPIYVALTS